MTLGAKTGFSLEKPIELAEAQDIYTWVSHKVLSYRKNGDKMSKYIKQLLTLILLLTATTQIPLVQAEGKQVDQPYWSFDAKAPVSHIQSGDINGDGIQEVVVVTITGLVYVLESDGNLDWQYETGFEANTLLVADLDDNPETAEIFIGGDGQEILLTVNGRVFQLDGETPTLISDFGETAEATAIQLDTTLTAGFEEGRFKVMAGDEVIRQGSVEGEISDIALGDINGDEQIEIVLGTQSGYIHLFGLTQPLLLTKPDLTETHTGYAYSVQVHDPQGNAVPVTLEIWAPADHDWFPQPFQSLPKGQTRGKLSWNVEDSFDAWDAGKASRFRFVYNDGQNSTRSIPGPLMITTSLFSIYHGYRIGPIILAILVFILGKQLYHLKRAYSCSPVGRAKSMLKRLRSNPDEAFLSLHRLTRDDPIPLTHLSGLAREDGQTDIANMSEGFHLILTRPEVTNEGLRAILEACEQLNCSTDEQVVDTTNLYTVLLESLKANTVDCIAALRPCVNESGKIMICPKTKEQDMCPVLIPLKHVSAEVVTALTGLTQVIRTLNNYQRVETVEDKTAYLAQSYEALGRLKREFRATLPQPEGNIFVRIAENWMQAVTNTLQDLQGRAQLEVALKTRQLLNLEQAALSVELTNTGRSPASNVAVTFIPNKAQVVGNGAARLDILPAGHSTIVEVAVSAASSVEQFRAEFNVTFDDHERSGKAVSFADMVQLLKPDTEFHSIPNPYAPGTPLAPGSPIFFGRDDIFQFMAENIAGLIRQNILVLIGQRRMGKTSLLQQLPAQLGEAYLPVYIDGQSLGIDPGMSNFFYDISLVIVDTLVDQGIEIEEPEPEDFTERPSGTFERNFLPTVFKALGQRKLLLLFDEFEELEMRVASGKLEPTIFPFFRHLMQHNRQLGFIFVGTHHLESLSTDYWSIFFNIALYKHITFLDDAAARALITEPVAEYGLVYDDLALDKMLRVTAGQPYFVQLTCHALVNHANRKRRGYLTIQDVNDVLGEMVELGEAHFAFLWEQSNPMEQLILVALMRLQSQSPTVTAAQMAKLLTERHVPLAMSKITETLRRLVNRDIVRETSDQPTRYEYKIELVRLWVERYKALGRVVEAIAAKPELT